MCTKEMPFVSPPFCTRCGTPFACTLNEHPHRCQACLDPSLPDIRVRSAGAFSGTLRNAIVRFKFHGDLCTGAALAQVLVERFTLLYEDGDYDRIMPVPLHPRRLREREFNQSAVLAKPLSRHLSLPLDLDSVRRTRDTKPQSLLGLKERKNNIKGAYTVVKPALVRDARILIVDDVCTTGATLDELAFKLLDHGASRVDALTVARA